MKVTKFKDELKQLDEKKLQDKLDQLRRELFSLRLNAQTAHVKNHAQFNELQRNIARVLTVIGQKEAQQ